MICLMGFLAFYNLSGVELRDFAILRSLENIGLASFSFTAHPYARMAVFGFLFVGALALLYGLQVADPAEQALSLIAIASAVGVGFSANLITLFIFWEILTFSVAILILLKLTPQALRMGYRFMIFHVLGGLLLLLGIIQQSAATGSFAIMPPATGLIYFGLAVAFKAAFLPFHVWVIWGYPTASFPVSVVLAGLTTKVGVYALSRFLPPHEFIILMGASMAVFGMVCALMQKDLRRLLSYHVISQVGYMVAGVGVGTAAGIDGGLLHVVNSALYKAPLFMSAGAVLFAAGTENLHDLQRHKEGEETTPLWKNMPVAALGAVVGALAISGVPPFNGYVSKYLLKTALDGVVVAEWMLMFAGVGTVVSLCNLVYFGFIKARIHPQRKIPVTMKAGIMLASAFCLILGIWPQLMGGILPFGSKLAVYSAQGVSSAMQFLVIGLLVFIVLKNVLEKGIKPPSWLSVEYLFYRPLYRAVLRACQIVCTLDRDLDQLYESSSRLARHTASLTKSFDAAINEAYERSSDLARRLADGTQQFDSSLNEAYEKSGQLARGLADKTAQLDDSLDEMYEQSGQLVRGLADKTAQFDDTLDALYEQSGQRSRSLWDKIRGRPSDWNIRNLNFDSLLIALMLGLFLFILVYFTR